MNQAWSAKVDDIARGASGAGDPNISTWLTSIGGPNAGAKLEKVDWTFRYHAWLGDFAQMGNISFQYDLFQLELKNNLARNKKFPTTSDSTFFNFAIQPHFMFILDPAMFAPSVPTFDAMGLTNLAEFFIAGNRFTYQITDKQYWDGSMIECSTFNLPAVINGALGQPAPSPFAVGANTFQQHHRIAQELNEPAVWAGNNEVKITDYVNPKGWWNDLTGADPGVLVAPWSYSIQVVIAWTFYGLKVRKIV